MSEVLVELSTSEPSVNTPVVAPGLSVPPMVAVPLTFPEPPSVPADTVTAPGPIVPLTSRVPLVTAVVPE